jgi:RHS repeat-associated protein
VYAYYEQSSGWGTTNAPLTTLVTAIAGAFGGVSGAVGESGSIFSGVNTALGGFGLGANAGDGAPSAFLNYILFDKNYKVMNMGWKVVPTTARFAKQRVTLPTINVKEAGYLFTYLSYEDQSNNYVYFDDYKVTYTPTNIVQYNEYYPYGLVTNNSWTKENAVGNNFLGNGGTELNTTTSLYDLEYRNYDPALARMHQVDPMADKYASYTPYNYSFNAPSNFNDVNGADPSPGEPDHVTRRGYQVLMANFDTAFPSGGGSGSLFDNIWGAGGFNNIGGIANGNQQLQDFYSMSNDQYVGKYGTKVSASSYGSYANAYNNLIVSRLSVSLSQNGTSYGYNLGLNVAGKVVYADRSILTNGKGRNATIFDLGGYYSEVVASRLTQGTCPYCLNPNTIGQNIAGLSYPGGDNPRSYNGQYNYSYVPSNLAEYPAIGHDRRYDNLGTAGLKGLFTDTRAIGADWKFVKEEFDIAATKGINPIDRVSAFGLGFGLGFLASFKTIYQGAKGPQGQFETMAWYYLSNQGVTNSPDVHKH